MRGSSESISAFRFQSHWEQSLGRIINTNGNGKRTHRVATELLTGQFHFHVTERCQTCEQINYLVPIANDYPNAVSIRIALDKLSTHNPAAFYRFFSPEKAPEYL